MENLGFCLLGFVGGFISCIGLSIYLGSGDDTEEHKMFPQDDLL